MNKVKKDTASEPDNANNWDDFQDRLQEGPYEDKGIAQLGRRYKKNGQSIYHHDLFDESDIVTPIPIVAIGITAFLADDNLLSFRSAANGKGWNAGKGTQIFFQSYYDNCMKSLKYNEKHRTIFESDWKSEMELAQDHCRYEELILSQQQWFYTEVKDTERSIAAIIKRAAEEYPKWVKENKIAKEVPDTSQIVTGGNENQLAIKTRLIISNHIETIDSNLGWEYAFNNQDDYDLFLNLATGFFNYNPIPSPNQIIRLKLNCKTRFAKTLNLIYKELSNRTLKSDVEFFKLIRILNHFQNLTDIEIYNAVTR